MTASFCRKVFEHTWRESAETYCPSFSFFHGYLTYILSRKMEMGKVRWSSAFGFGQGFKVHSVFPILPHLHLEIMTF